VRAHDRAHTHGPLPSVLARSPPHAQIVGGKGAAIAVTEVTGPGQIGNECGL
jgi:hypothetical protein